MKKFLAISVLLLFVFAACDSSGSAGHDPSARSREFRIENAKVKLELSPAMFMRGTPSAVTVTLTDFMSGSPVLDAELYLLVESAGQTSAMPAQPGNSMPRMDRPDKSGAGDSGLDFGESPQTPSSVDLARFTKLMPQQKAGTY
ncbi:MAG TPA: hypothetical protein VF790_03350, partial [Dissulfurispiraceae bacterium]